jgi:hypothetical protein
MEKLNKYLGASILSIALVGGVSQPALARECFGSLTQALARAGYSGDTYCQYTRHTLRRIGSVDAFGKRYEFYRLFYVTTNSPSGSEHGGERLLIFSSQEYIGQYSVDPFVNARFFIKNNVVHISARGFPSETITMTKDGPPGSTHIVDDVAGLYK